MTPRSRIAARRRILAAVLLGGLLAAPAAAQSLPDGSRLSPDDLLSERAFQHFRTRLLQIDQLIQLGYHSRAHALLEELAQAGLPAQEVRHRRLRIARALGDHDTVVELAREILRTEPGDASLWRELAAALYARGEPRAGREALDRFLELAGEVRSGFTVAVDLLRDGGLCGPAVALADSARSLLAEPTFLARQRALCLLAVQRPVEAAHDALADLAGNPHNLQLLRRDLLADDSPPLPPAFRQELARLAVRPDAPAAARVLAANLEVHAGRTAAALEALLPALREPGAAALAGQALQNAGTLTRELPLLARDEERSAVSDYLQAVLPELAEHPGLSLRLRQRACDHLAEACLHALERGLLAEEPRRAAARFGRQLALVQRIHPESSHLDAAQIQLARFTRDDLRDPLAAAARLEHLLQDLDLPLEGVAVVRLTLGESYLAARDTVRARAVLTALGRDPEFRGPAGHAHFLLAKLDLAQGHFAGARDRFAAVALDDPAAPYANDALGLGLLVAEELQNPTGGLDLLSRYARSLWWQLAAEPDSQRTALERLVARAARQVDQTAPQPLLERARFELAGLLRDRGDHAAALDQLERLVLDLPHGRLAARALAERAGILAGAAGDSVAARREYERLLAQYPDYLFAAEIRRKLRTLP